MDVGCSRFREGWDGLGGDGGEGGNVRVWVIERKKSAKMSLVDFGKGEVKGKRMIVKKERELLRGREEWREGV